MTVQSLGLGGFTAVIPCSVPGWGTKIPQAERPGQKLKIQKKKKNFD